MPSSRNQRDAATTARVVRRRDLAALIALCAEHAAHERAAFDATGLGARLRTALFEGVPRLHVWVVERDGVLLGYAAASAEFSTWSGREHLHLDCLFLREAVRGHGLGAALLRCVCEYAAKEGFAEMQWQTPSWNRDAIRFYRRHGARDRAKRRFTLRLAP